VEERDKEVPAFLVRDDLGVGKNSSIIGSDPDVDSVSAFTGGGTGTNTARMFITLKPFHVRKANAAQVIARLRTKLVQVPGAPTYLQAVQELRIGGRLGAGLYQYTLQGDDLVELTRGLPVCSNECAPCPNSSM
jgi:multidrug efflux pump